MKKLLKQTTNILLSCISLFSCFALAQTSKTDETFKMQMPLECNYGTDCFIQNYVDVDNTNLAKDYKCGNNTYDKHTGTDIRLIDIPQMERGVNVLAVNNGVVTGVRNDDPTEFKYYQYRQLNKFETNPIDSKLACGNKIEIKHTNGYRTQYCHLKAGSILVKPGDIVTKGQILGKVGMSGQSEFPHLHIGVYKDGIMLNKTFAAIDPFTSWAVSENKNYSCDINHDTTLWDSNTYSNLKYIDGHILSMHLSDKKPNIQFADGSIDTNKQKEFIDQARRNLAFREDILTKESKYIFLWAEFMSIKANDIITFTIENQNGLIVNYVNTLKTNMAQYFAYTGRELKASLTSGNYQVKVVLTRDGKVIDTIMKNLTV